MVWRPFVPTTDRSMILAMRFVQRDLTRNGPLQKHYFGSLGSTASARSFSQ
jgi:hypothetical protein